MNMRLVFVLALSAGGLNGSPILAAATTAEGRVGNPVAVTPEQGPPRGNLLWTIPLKTLTATRERPLFRPSRRPSTVPLANAEPTVKIAPAPEPPRLVLVGTVAGTGEGIAVFLNPGTRDVLRLRTGEGHDGWTVREVRAREVVLERGREIVVFALPAATDEKK